MILLTAVVLTVLSYRSSRSALLAFARDLMVKNAEMVQMQLTAGGDEAARAVNMMQTLVRDGTIGDHDFPGMERCFYNYITVHVSVSALLYGNEKGESLMVKFLPNGSCAARLITGMGDARRVVWRYHAPGARFGQVTHEHSDNTDRYDPRTRPWYVEAKAAGRLHWTDVYIFHSDRKPGMSASAPCADRQGRFCGVVGIDMGLVDLSEFLAQAVHVGDSGQAFMLDNHGRIVATPRADDLAVADGRGGLRLRRLAESPHPELAALGDLPAFQAFFDAQTRPTTRPTALDDEPTGQTFRYDADGVATIAHLEAMRAHGGGWYVGVVAKEDECIAEAKRANVRSAVTAGVLTMLAVLVGGLVAGRIARSLRLLSHETARLERLDFEDTGPMASRFREVHRTLEAFQRMRTGLRAFGMYVPTTLVRTLLKQRVEPTLGGETRELTLLFSDIRNFTTTSERLSPMELADVLSRYLSAMTDCIHDHHGTVDKYNGDGVMAFWNAPMAVSDHPRQACLAAIECQRRIDSLEAELGGTIDLYTRVGVHTATVTVGNFGSTDRLNYTAMGDGVNLASRLEGVNKYFGTRMLISEDTWSRVSDHVEVRQIGLVSVKGRAAACAIYELLGEKGRVDDQRLAWARRYEQALSHYRARRWQEAIDVLDGLRHDTPDDVSIACLADACRHARQHEPPPDWDGTFTMTAK